MNLMPVNGSKVSGRELRRRLNQEASFVQGEMAPLVAQLAHNDGVSQKKITALELRLDALNHMTWLQRCRWLLKGQI